MEHGLIFEKGKGFFAKNPEDIRSGLRVDFKIIWGVFYKISWEGLWSAGLFWKSRRVFFRKKTTARPIWAVRAADRTAAKSRRRGHPEAAPWPHQIISLDLQIEVAYLWLLVIFSYRSARVLLVWVWCSCVYGVGVCLYMNRCYSCIQIRGDKKKR